MDGVEGNGQDAQRRIGASEDPKRSQVKSLDSSKCHVSKGVLQDTFEVRVKAPASYALFVAVNLQGPRPTKVVTATWSQPNFRNETTAPHAPDP